MILNKIRTEEDFKNKLDEISQIFGVKFNINDKNVYMTNEFGEIIKMKNNGNYYSGYVNNKKICFDYTFVPRYFSTSVLIEIFSSDGKNRNCCRIEQELRPESGIREYPSFMFNIYNEGKSYLFFSNSFVIETAITHGVDYHIFNFVKKYENNGKVKTIDRILAKFTKPNITHFLCGLSDFEANKGEYYPWVELEIFRDYVGKKYMLNVASGGTCREYFDITQLYKYNSEILYNIIPFFEYETIDEKQYIEGLDSLTQEEWNNLFLSIIQNENSISCFEDVIDYFDNSMFGLYISRYYSKLINQIRDLQAGQIRNNNFFGKKLLKDNKLM